MNRVGDVSKIAPRALGRWARRYRRRELLWKAPPELTCLCSMGVLVEPVCEPRFADIPPDSRETRPTRFTPQIAPRGARNGAVWTGFAPHELYGSAGGGIALADNTIQALQL